MVPMTFPLIHGITNPVMLVQSRVGVCKATIDPATYKYEYKWYCFLSFFMDGNVTNNREPVVRGSEVIFIYQTSPRT